ncbi:MAG TPA: DUF4139 domain-containing protein [Kofleriaceae bacterium]|jgi:uncharacterized protein (TIGR02231 family)|nr:DUF4139 domain-containing protein [Kofleriaceae bacterium]
MNAPITSVTVLEDRASVTRRGTVQLAAGQHRVVVEGVAPVLVDKTLTAVAAGGRVLDVRCERYLAPWVDPDLGSDLGSDPSSDPSSDPGARAADAIAALHAERTRLDTERDIHLARIATARAELAALAEVATAALRDLAIAAGRATAAADADRQLAELDAADVEARVRLVNAELAARDLEQAQGRLAARIARAEAETGTQAARLVIDLQVDAPAAVALTIGYIVPGAAWRPYHRAVLTRGAAGQPASVAWQTTACVWQATGEDWTSVALVFSLERPSLGVEPPALTDDELAARRRPDTVTVEARDQDHQTTGLGTAGPAQVPGIDDGGLGITLAAARATVIADGAPHRVPVGEFTARAELDLIAIPLRSPAVHLRARLVNAGSVPLLAGPVDLVMASGYVGRTEIGFIAPGEQLAVGFGPQADVRVHRSEARERDDAGLLGGWNVTTVRVAVRLSNLGAQPRAVTVIERIPISEVEQVEVQAAAPDGYLLGADDSPGGEAITQVTARAIDDRGLVAWSVELPPLGRRAVTLEYRVKAQRGVTSVLTT